MGFALYLWQKLQVRAGKHNTLLLIALGLTGIIGYYIKASVVILYVAFLAFAFVRFHKARLKNIAIIAFTFVVVSASYSAWLGVTEVIDLTDLDRYKLPYEHYIMMGLADSGGYNVADYELSTSIPDLATRKATNLAEIQSRLADYGIEGYLSFLRGKIKYTWLDGTYFAIAKLSITPLNDTVLSAIFRTDGQYYAQYRALALGAQVGVLLLMLLSVFSKEKFASVMALSVFGLFLFLLIWETRSRYLVNFIPVFLLLAQCGLESGLGWLTLSTRRAKAVQAQPAQTPELQTV